MTRCRCRQPSANNEYTLIWKDARCENREMVTTREEEKSKQLCRNYSNVMSFYGIFTQNTVNYRKRTPTSPRIDSHSASLAKEERMYELSEFFAFAAC